MRNSTRSACSRAAGSSERSPTVAASRKSWKSIPGTRAASGKKGATLSRTGDRLHRDGVLGFQQLVVAVADGDLGDVRDLRDLRLRRLLVRQQRGGVDGGGGEG